jgi:hypothetical protein
MQIPYQLFSIMQNSLCSLLEPPKTFKASSPAKPSQTTINKAHFWAAPNLNQTGFLLKFKIPRQKTTFFSDRVT